MGDLFTLKNLATLVVLIVLFLVNDVANDSILQHMVCK